MNTTHRVISATGALMLLSACATNSVDPKLVQLSNPQLEKPRVAVLPFQVVKEESDGQKMVRDFERTYFAYRLVSALQTSPTFGEVYFSPSSTPAADYVVKGLVTKSDGKQTRLHVEVVSANGRKCKSSNFTVTVASSEFKPNTDPAGRIWLQVAKDLGAIKQRPGELAAARTHGFRRTNTVVVNDRAAQIAAEAADVECKQLLAPMTEELRKRAALGTPLYVSWQQEATPLVEQRSAEKAQATANGVLAVLAGAAAVAEGATGNTTDQQQALQTMTTSMNNIDVANAKIGEINKNLESLAQSFIMDKGTTVTVKIFGKVYTLHGSLEKQQEELHNVVLAELNKA